MADGEHGPFIDRCDKRLSQQHCWHKEQQQEICCWCGKVKTKHVIDTEEIRKLLEKHAEKKAKEPPPQWPKYQPSWPPSYPEHWWWHQYPPGTILCKMEAECDVLQLVRGRRRMAC